ncbi:putative ATP-dependent helicase IRC3 [Stylophora pistillata]|uniref:putative ATP-dependent helicase IRC3 n=1 Tax=Stylophora pistillata TaxID=50429 RepID=UPI000C040782|nr:putative ATP-dependent helicase IRC3 [Stylophora pistillata]
MVNLVLQALETRQNTLCIAPTGAGKTIIMSSLIEEILQLGQKALVLQHRQELIIQNAQSFRKVTKGLSTSVVNAERKDFERDVVFAMVPTLDRRQQPLPHFDLVAVDEAHHSVASSWKKLIKKLQTENPALKVIGFTATPNRGDKKGLSEIFDHVADQIMLGELVNSGSLAPPRTLAIQLDEDSQKLLKALYWTPRGKPKKGLNGARMLKKAGEILDKNFYNEEVFRHWKEQAQTRKTVIFCSNVLHAQSIENTFNAQGVSTGHINGQMSMKDRSQTLRDFQKGRLQVITNVAVLTKGWDCPDVECIILLRPSSYKSTMIQMVGRGLRPHPGKKDCLILDFGLSSRVHGSLEQDVKLYSEKKQALKKCRKCKALMKRSLSTCPECGYVHLATEEEIYALNPEPPKFYQRLTLREISLLEL